MDRFQISFELRPLADVVPWGDPTSGLRLHWFGLTDGWYDVVIGEHRLYSILGETRGIDYQVVRLWEDLIDVAADALEPVPEPLASRLASFDAWTSWVEKAQNLDGGDDVVQTALEWWFHRQISAIHLVGAPTLQLWRCDDELRLSWKSVPRGSAAPNWSSPQGQAIASADAFREELFEFDRALMCAMSTRINEIERGWHRPEVAIDVEDLRREQGDRASWLQRGLQGHRQRSWSDVVEAVIALERRIGGV